MYYVFLTQCTTSSLYGVLSHLYRSTFYFRTSLQCTTSSFQNVPSNLYTMYYFVLYDVMSPLHTIHPLIFMPRTIDNLRSHFIQCTNSSLYNVSYHIGTMYSQSPVISLSDYAASTTENDPPPPYVPYQPAQVQPPMTNNMNMGGMLNQLQQPIQWLTPGVTGAMGLLDDVDEVTVSQELDMGTGKKWKNWQLERHEMK